MLKLDLRTILKGVAVTTAVILITGCNISAPRPRMGTLPTPPPGPRFSDPNNLGKHSYYFNPFEVDGILYTCKGGHIDLTHVRWNADYTRYAIKKTRKTLMKKGKGFSFNLTWELSTHKFRFSYPENWDSLSRDEKEKIADEVAYEIGPYIAFNATLWHEILTWFGVHFAGFEPEFNSAFSWEDVYSNLLGTKLAIEALRDTDHSYDTAMTLAIDRDIEMLGAKSKSTAIKLTEAMRGKWFKGYFNVTTIKKNMDIGLDDGYITPTLIPGICPGAQPASLPVPTTNILTKYGLSMTYQIYPREFERGKIFKVAYQNEKRKGPYVVPAKHYPLIMAHIRKQAVEKYGYNID